MGYLIQASRDDPNIGLSLAVSPSSVGVTGAVVAIRDETQPQAPAPLYLDFSDDTFKTVGWVTRQAPLTALGGNFFALDGGLDLSAFTNLPADTRSLAAEYEATLDSGTLLLDIDHLELQQGDTQVHVGWARLDAANVEVTISGKRRGRDFPLTAASISFLNSDGTLRFGPLGPGVPDAQGVIRLSAANALVVQASYWRATVTDTIGTYQTTGHVPFTF